MNFNDLLKAHGIDATTVLVMRHCPVEPPLRKVLPWLAAERPDIFNAYQQSHKLRTEKRVTRAKYIASFIGHSPGKAVFVGLYRIASWQSVTRKQFSRMFSITELCSLGLTGWAEGDGDTTLWFDLKLESFYADWKGKLVINWSPPERTWCRWAAGNTFGIHAIGEQSILISDMPEWDELILTWDEVKALPISWRAALAQWRGVYFILDTSDGRAYIGSAYGGDNILGR